MRPKFPRLFLLIAAIIFVGSVVGFAPDLPERVATHFDGSGTPNGWMSRREHLVFITLFGLGFAAFEIGVCYGIRFLPSSLVNVPNATYWRSAENFPEACATLLRWSFLCGAASLLWVAALNYQLVAANRLVPPHLEATPVMIEAGLFVAATGILMTILIRSFAKPA
ncbi:MAG: DUF1648 domain-containing protein [Verrucomicrobiales bacterium]